MTRDVARLLGTVSNNGRRFVDRAREFCWSWPSRGPDFREAFRERFRTEIGLALRVLVLPEATEDDVISWVVEIVDGRD